MAVVFFGLFCQLVLFGEGHHFVQVLASYTKPSELISTTTRYLTPIDFEHLFIEYHHMIVAFELKKAVPPRPIRWE